MGENYCTITKQVLKTKTKNFYAARTFTLNAKFIGIVHQNYFKINQLMAIKT